MIRKQALITGAASGLGLEFCRLLAADSYELVMVDKDENGLELAPRFLPRNLMLFALRRIQEGIVFQND
jgi:uncharacterized protein